MKPDELRRRRKREEHSALVRGERLEAFLRSGEPVDAPTPELVPTPEDKTHTLRRYRRLVRLAAGEMRGTRKHAQFLDRAVVELARLVWIERVLALDPLERAALTPARLTALSVVDPDELRRRLGDLQEGVAR